MIRYARSDSCIWDDRACCRRSYWQTTLETLRQPRQIGRNGAVRTEMVKSAGQNGRIGSKRALSNNSGEYRSVRAIPGQL